jgi:hypothetical protein
MVGAFFIVLKTRFIFYNVVRVVTERYIAKFEVLPDVSGVRGDSTQVTLSRMALPYRPKSKTDYS